MTSIFRARWMHTNLYLNAAENADQLFLEEKTKEKGLSVLDQNREQIDTAIEWVVQQVPTNETDILLARFADALSAIGMIRYSVPDTLIPLSEKKIVAAQRLGSKELEADSLDGLGILYAFLGYMSEAVYYFEQAYEIADQVKHEELKREIKTHLKLARKQMSNRQVSPRSKFLGAIQLIRLHWKYYFVRATRKPFAQVTTLNKIASLYLILGKWDFSIRYYQQAISISKEHLYRFGELEASMGLLQAEMSKEKGGNGALSAGNVSNLVTEIGFEWSIDFSVFETLLEIAPTIKDVEIIANQLAKINDPRASEIYGLLDQIMINTTEIVTTASEESVHKHKLFLNALERIKDDLASIVKIASEGNS